MKKFLVLILAVLYMASSTGATFHMHYCNGRLVDVALSHEEQEGCEKCGPETANTCAKDCCKDVHKTVKLDKDQQIKESSTHPAEAAIITTKTDFSAQQLLLTTHTHPVSHAPPRPHPVATYILLCTFRI